MSVEPEVGESFAGDTARFTTGFPLRHAKVERPMLPRDTLGRERLLAWLDAHLDRRVLYLVAEAGFGKTTLIADYARRSRLRTFWYRLDEDDTDGLAFLRYLVAACQAVGPNLLLRTSALLNEPSIEPLRSDAICTVMLSEVEPLGEIPSLLVLDDFHMVESIPSITAIVERLIERIPVGLTIAIATRHEPPLCVASLRSRSQLAELGREDLRFNECETEQLFHDAYHLPLEADVLRDLSARTDGWAASLQLVKTAIENRTPIQTRAFVRSLSGAEGDLYDYLAEEVVGDLEPDLRGFLLRASLLEELDPSISSVAGDITPQHARFLLGQAEHLGLLSRSDGIVGAWRAHPLVREFLLARLELELGPDRVTDLHRLLASALEPQSWRLAAIHWSLAKESQQVVRVVTNAGPRILGTGDFAAAEELLGQLPDHDSIPWLNVMRTRRFIAQGRFDRALALAHCDVLQHRDLLPSDPDLLSAMALNWLGLGLHTHDAPLRERGLAILCQSADAELASIARSSRLISDDFRSDLDRACESLQETARLSRQRGHARHGGIGLINLAAAELQRDNAELACEFSTQAINDLAGVGVASDVAVARSVAARALARVGSRDAFAYAAQVESHQGWLDPEALTETCELDLMYGDATRARRLLETAWATGRVERDSAISRVAEARLLLTEGGDGCRALALLDDLPLPDFYLGFRAGLLALRVFAMAVYRSEAGVLGPLIEEALGDTDRQHAAFASKSIRLTRALAGDTDGLRVYINALPPRDTAFLSILAELVILRLGDLDPHALEMVRDEAALRPERWRGVLRRQVTSSSAGLLDLTRAVALLEEIGDVNDIPPLRNLARVRALRLPEAGLALAKRLAPPAYIEDLGRITIRVGSRRVEGAHVRRKVLSLLAYLLTRPQLSAPREQVIEALWPEMEPEQGANSLNQTAYFLRQMFEPKGSDDSSAGYLNCSADLIWLDPALVSCRSAECQKLISNSFRDFSPAAISQLADKYTAPFAMDFPYEEWASSYRNSLHASYLDRVERSVVMDTKAGNFERALSVAKAALAADPDAERMEFCLLRVYRLTGATAAAAEQYTHYASVLRDQLGIEPPPLEQI